METFVALMIWLHVGLGAIAIVAGALALVVRKGSPNHIRSGLVFAITMVSSSLVGSILGLIRAEDLYITMHGGILGVTLICSSVLTLRSKGAGLKGWALVVALVNAANFAGLVVAGWYALSLPGGQLASFYAEDYFFLAGMAGIAAIGDGMLLFGKTSTYPRRIARHLWRMCLGFFIAAGSAFTGPGMKAFPQAIQQSGLLSLPEFLILVMMLYWLGRTLLKKPSLAEEKAA